MEILEKEYTFWMTKRLAPGYENLNRYYSSTDLPRPESYREDTELAK
jgi:neutral trehalase